MIWHGNAWTDTTGGQEYLPSWTCKKWQLRYALKKKYGIIWKFFPTWGGGLPNSQNPKPKKVPLNYPKIIQKTN